MNVSLTAELEQMVADKVASGMYHTASEVVRAALRLLNERDLQLDASREPHSAGPPKRLAVNEKSAPA